MADDIVSALRTEIAETQKRREKLLTLKVTFVTALLGFGSLKSEENSTQTYQLLYLAPMAVCFFDLLILGEHFSIRRIGCFLRTICKDKGEIEWQEFVRNHRDKFFRFGSWGFTVLTFAAAIMLLWKSQRVLTVGDEIWFGFNLVGFLAVQIWGLLELRRLDTLNPPNSKGAIQH
jgi:hypothetical protein